MSIIDSKTFTFERFRNLLSSAAILDEIKGIIVGSQDYSYQGYNAEAIFKSLLLMAEKANKTENDFVKDVSMLLTIFHVRGPNITNVKANNTKGGAAKANEVANLKKTYAILAKVGDQKDSVTLPRMSLAFPGLSMTIWQGSCDKGVVNMPVSITEIGLKDNCKILSANFVPSLLTNLTNDENQTAFFIHVLFQCCLSEKTQTKANLKGGSRKMAFQFFNISTNYSHLSLMGSNANSDEKKIMSGKIESMDLTSLDMYKIFTDFFSNGMDNIEHRLTKYHWMAAFIKLNRTDFKSVPNDIFTKDFATIKSLYPIQR